MAARLKILLSRHKKVLFVGGLAHWTSISALLGDDAVRPAELLIRNSKPPGKSVIIHPSMAVNYTDHFPVMSTLYEAWRGNVPLCKLLLPARWDLPVRQPLHQRRAGSPVAGRNQLQGMSGADIHLFVDPSGVLPAMAWNDH